MCFAVASGLTMNSVRSTATMNLHERGRRPAALSLGSALLLLAVRDAPARLAGGGCDQRLLLRLRRRAAPVRERARGLHHAGRLAVRAPGGFGRLLRRAVLLSRAPPLEQLG